jgi:hypothetical protein
MTQYYRCDLAMETGTFGLFDCQSGDAVRIDTDAACRQLAEERYPGCTFALTTMTHVYEANTNSSAPLALDLVVIAVCLPAPDGTVAVHAYIFGTVHGRWCVPFAPAVWPDAYDLLTQRN